MAATAFDMPRHFCGRRTEQPAYWDELASLPRQPEWSYAGYRAQVEADYERDRDVEHAEDWQLQG